MTEFDLRSLLDTLHERDIRFVVIGGVAVGAHGYVRATADLDLVPDPDPENLDRLVTALDSLEATLPTAGDRRFSPDGDAGVIRRGGNVTADTKFGGLDIVQLIWPSICQVLNHQRPADAGLFLTQEAAVGLVRDARSG